jgi:hypothetical protein
MLLLAAQVGDEVVARWCADLLRGRTALDDPRRPSIEWLGGRHAASELRRGDMQARGQEYWVRVWAARGLLYVYTRIADEAILAGLHDPAWRVREMCAKVARTHGVAGAEPILARLLDDTVPRVRVAAEAALTESARSTESRTPRASPPRRRRP